MKKPVVIGLAVVVPPWLPEATGGIKAAQDNGLTLYAAWMYGES